MPKTVLITGVRSGIGYELARRYLAAGHDVLGLGRGSAEDLIRNPRFAFCSVDLSRTEEITSRVSAFLFEERAVAGLDHVFLHAGQFGKRIATVKDTPQSELDELMKLHVWANKALLDLLLDAGVTIGACVFSASIAGVRARAGNGGYAISKAALNMLAKLYALEYPEVFFAVIGLCAVDTAMSRLIGSLPLDERFVEQKMLRERGARPDYVVTAERRADHLFRLLADDPRKVLTSGDFVEIRELLKSGAIVADPPSAMRVEAAMSIPNI